MSIDPITAALLVFALATGPAGIGTALVSAGIRTVGTTALRLAAQEIVGHGAAAGVRAGLVRILGTEGAKALEVAAVRAVGGAPGRGAAKGAGDLAATAAALAPAPFRMPLRGGTELARAFDKPPQNWKPGHRGVDLTSRSGAAVVSASNGVVFFAGTVGGKPTVSVLHGNGVRTTYEPVVAAVKKGDAVTAGQTIGRLRPGHCAPGSCLHWGAIKGTEYIDPLTLVGQVRLLPVR